MISPQELQKLRDLPIEGVAQRLGLQVSRGRFLCPVFRKGKGITSSTTEDHSNYLDVVTLKEKDQSKAFDVASFPMEDYSKDWDESTPTQGRPFQAFR